MNDLTQMNLNENTSIHEILIRNKQTTDVFQTFGINSNETDFRTLDEICEIRGIELSVLIECLNLVDPGK